MRELWEQYGLYVVGLLVSYWLWVARSIFTNEKRISLIEQKLEGLDAKDIAREVAKHLREDS